MSKRKPDEGRYSRVSRRVWGSSDFRALSAPKPNAQTLWFRLLTGPELDMIPGLFPLREAGLAEALGWPVAALRRCLTEITSRGMATYDKLAGLVWVPRAIGHNPPDNPNVIVGWKVAWKDLPDCALKESAKSYLMGWAQARGDVWAKVMSNVTGNPFPQPCPQPFGEGYGKQDEEEDEEEEIPQPPSGIPDRPRPRPSDPMGPSFLPVRDDVTELHESWKRTTGLMAHRLKGPTDFDAVTLAETLDMHGMRLCRLALSAALSDPMVTGEADEKRVAHKSIGYIFGNGQAFARLVKAAEDRERKRTGSGALERAMTAEPDTSDVYVPAPRSA